MLNRDSVQRLLRRELSLEGGDRRVPPAERGIAEMMIALYRHFAKPLMDETMFAWHRMVVSGRHDIEAVGSSREHADVMHAAIRDEA